MGLAKRNRSCVARLPDYPDVVDGQLKCASPELLHPVGAVQCQNVVGVQPECALSELAGVIVVATRPCVNMPLKSA
jgi:hypothetical protein